MLAIVEFGDFGDVKRSNRVLFRDVVNDAVVGPWVIDWVPDADPPLREHSITGLREWMACVGDYDSEKLEGPLLPFDEHLWNYGLRMQFWVPSLADLELPANEGRVTATCLDATGRDWLEEGKEYLVRGMRDGMVTVLVSGDERECMADRFRIA